MERELESYPLSNMTFVTFSKIRGNVSLKTVRIKYTIFMTMGLKKSFGRWSGYYDKLCLSSTKLHISLTQQIH